MPTIDENREIWSGTYEWPHGGEEWSEEWGGAHMQWFGAVLPRISSFVPTDTILEIAPGYGRWTAFLKDMCSRLMIVDLTPQCIEKCRERFVRDSNIRYFVNDGMSLEMAEDGSIDFIFSFDSLVHAEEVVLKAYVAEFAKKLRPDGVAFIHHSNLGEYARLASVEAWLGKVPKLLRRLGVCDDVTSQWRARSMTAAKMVAFAEIHGLQCVSQELVTWQTNSALIDCFSTIVRNDSRWSRGNHILRNPGFMREAKRLRTSVAVKDGIKGNHWSGGKSEPVEEGSGRPRTSE